MRELLRNDIRFLGTCGSKKEDRGSTCVQLSPSVLIDAGNIIHGLGEDAKHIEHIFLTHSHLDHISDIAFLVDAYLHERTVGLKIYGLKETLDALHEHIFNWEVWPDFKEISLSKSGDKAIEFVELTLGKMYHFEEVSLKPIPLNHTVPTCGYVIIKNEFSALYATDTYLCETIWDELNHNTDITSLIIDVSFPSDMNTLAMHSKHLTPRLLKQELTKLKRQDVDVYITHIKPCYQEIVERELRILELLKGKGRILQDGEYLLSLKPSKNAKTKAMEISTALSKEKDLGKILGLILVEAMEYTGAEGGTIYLKEQNQLSFKAVKNIKLGIFELNLASPKIVLYQKGVPNSENISAVCALSKKTINIPDIYLYHLNGFNFEGAKKFDKANKYRTQSMLVVPMLNQDDEVVGVMQLINKITHHEAVAFTQDDIEQTTTYANLAASAIAKNRLIEDLEKLVLSFLESISYALSVKSPYGYGHISRVKELMNAVAYEINRDTTTYPDIHYSKEALEELELAAWMHDIGKIATPEHILDKSTRLETLHDRIETIEMRFNFVKYFLKSELLETRCKFLNGEYQIHIDQVENRHRLSIEELEANLAFIKICNLPSTIMREDDVERIREIGDRRYVIEGKEVALLTPDEVDYLSIRRGTLSVKERQKINEHAKTTYDMLKMITFPKKYNRVAEIASGHHEKLNGKGYPLGLSKNQISFEARMLAIVDILEALTASDRPYKRAKSEEETFAILEAMVKEQELDGGLVAFMKKANIFKKYIQKEEKAEAFA